MIFKVHAYNIPQIKGVIMAHGECWFHGDGNCYDKEIDSRNHRDFVNPKQEEAKYRILFKSLSQLPKFVNGSTKEETEELNKESVNQLTEMLMKSKNEEIREERKETQTKGVKTIAMTDDMRPKGLLSVTDEPAGPTPAELEAQEQTRKARETTQDQAEQHRKNMEAFSSKMDTLDQRLKDLDLKSKELDLKSAELERKSAALDKKAPKTQAAATNGEAPQQ